MTENEIYNFKNNKEGEAVFQTTVQCSSQYRIRVVLRLAITKTSAVYYDLSMTSAQYAH